MNKEELEIFGSEYLKSELYKKHQKENNEKIKLRNKFVNHMFPIDKIKNLTIDEYIEGKKCDTSFCYLVEFKMQELGQIRGSFPASKFGIYYSNDKDEYIYLKKFGNTKEEAFNNIKKEIIDLINCGSNRNFKKLQENKLSPMFKGKIYFLYFPEQTLPIYNEIHVDFFLGNLEIKYDKYSNYFEKINLMISWKNESEIFNKFTNLEFMRFLYSSYAFEKDIIILKNKEKIKDELQVLNVNFISDKDIIDRMILKNTHSNSKPNFDEINKKKSAMGLNGEMFVLEYEKENNRKCSRRIQRVGDDPSYGYDILSYDKSGAEKHIEVKTCSKGSFNRVDFFITKNEYEKLQDDPCYAIYYVYGLSINKPEIIAIKKDNLLKVNFEPYVYKITASVENK